MQNFQRFQLRLHRHFIMVSDNECLVHLNLGNLKKFCNVNFKYNYRILKTDRNFEPSQYKLTFNYVKVSTQSAGPPGLVL